MKQLSIEEKAKAYDEALKVLHKYDGAHIMFTQDLKEEMFPELKESEGEIVIAALKSGINGLLKKEYHLKGIGGISFDRIIAWLEKQGETFTKKDVDDAYLKGVCDAKHELEKQGKNNMGISEATKKELEDKLHKALEKETAESFNKFLDEQNPAWGEEDEDIIEWLIGYLEYQIMNASIIDEKNNCSNAISMLKSLKERVVPQPKQEWSEEDEQYIIDTLNLLSFGCSSHSVGEVKDFLKSIKDRIQPQNRWKPSDEQMVALDIATMEVWTIQNKEHLSALYQDLKKLRGKISYGNKRNT